MTKAFSKSTRISVVITSFREGDLKREAVSSVLPQLPSEIIIVNDASTHESTNKVCCELESFPEITVIWRQENGGPSVSRNQGFEKASGDILVPLDADDLLPENALKYLKNAFDSSSDVGFVCGPYLRQDRQSQPAKSVVPADVTLQTMLRAKRFSLSSCWQLLGTTPLRKTVWQQVGGYDPAFGACDLHDVEFWIRVIASGCSHITIDKHIYTWRKYLGKNSAQVTPLAWSQIAQKYFEIYQSLGLRYRAYELLLMGSKWQNDLDRVKFFREKLTQCVIQGHYQLSSVVILLLPTFLFRFLFQNLRYRR